MFFQTILKSNEPFNNNFSSTLHKFGPQTMADKNKTKRKEVQYTSKIQRLTKNITNIATTIFLCLLICWSINLTFLVLIKLLISPGYHLLRLFLIVKAASTKTSQERVTVQSTNLSPITAKMNAMRPKITYRIYPSNLNNYQRSNATRFQVLIQRHRVQLNFLNDRKNSVRFYLKKYPN